jgi:acyl dehydratase
MATSEIIKTHISDGMVEALRAQVGKAWAREYAPWEIDGSRISRSQIRRWAVHIGDLRPIFLDLDYATTTPWGTILAPPGMLQDQDQFDPGVQGLPGCQPILETCCLEWALPIRLGDLLVPTTTLRAVREVTQAPGHGRVVAQELETAIKNNAGALIGSVRSVWNCYERGSQAQRTLYGTRTEPHMYQREDIEALRAEYKREQPRGAAPLYWEDTGPGEELPTILKGPSTHTKYVGKGIGRWHLGHGQGWEMYEKHPQLFFMNEHHAPEPIEAVDWVHYRAVRHAGLPGAIESNTERIHWTIHHLMNWMGDHGKMRRLDLAFPVQNMLGDTTRCGAKVSGKRADGGAHIVDLEVWNTNQLGERVTTGTAEVELPGRSSK